MILKTNPSLIISWQDGKMVLSVPRQPKMVLSGTDSMFFLNTFSKGANLIDVIENIENSDKARVAVDKLIQCGALIDVNSTDPVPYDLRFDKKFLEIQFAVSKFTMGTPSINYALHKAVEYVVKAGIQGAIVESGVWKGGSAMICALTMKALNDTSREIYMFDTYGWIWPGLNEKDGFLDGRPNLEEMDEKGSGPFGPGKKMSETELADKGVSLNMVKQNLLSTGYPEEKLIFVKGYVEETIPSSAPKNISLLRLDTDLYKSTSHELKHLYPRLQSGGILLVDDYPTEKGVTTAVHEYFSKPDRNIFLSRLDIQGRIGTKP